MKAKKIIGIAVTGTLLLGLSSTALATNVKNGFQNLRSGAYAESDDEKRSSKRGFGAETRLFDIHLSSDTAHDYLVKIADRFGIMTEGLSNEEILTAILIYQAEKMGIDTENLVNMTPDEIKEELSAVIKEFRVSIKNDKNGIEEYSIEASSHEILVEMADKMGVETDGMTDEEIKTAISEHLKENGRKHGLDSHFDMFDHTENSHHFDLSDRIRQSLTEIANELAIESEGMTEDELQSAIFNKMRDMFADSDFNFRINGNDFGLDSSSHINLESASHDELVQIAENLDIDISGLSDDEIITAIQESLQIKSFNMKEDFPMKDGHFGFFKDSIVQQL